MRESVNLRELYAEYSDRVQFLVIYIREAHPTDGWVVNNKYHIRDPKTMAERRDAAGMCETAAQYDIKTYVDEMDDAVMIAYAAWPERLYLLDNEGRVVYAGGPGPRGFSPSELNEAIVALLSQQP